MECIATENIKRAKMIKAISDFSNKLDSFGNLETGLCHSYFAR